MATNISGRLRSAFCAPSHGTRELIVQRASEWLASNPENVGVVLAAYGYKTEVSMHQGAIDSQQNDDIDTPLIMPIKPRFIRQATMFAFKDTDHANNFIHSYVDQNLTPLILVVTPNHMREGVTVRRQQGWRQQFKAA